MLSLVEKIERKGESGKPSA